jgi:signal transduction histidine kinase
MDLLPTLLRISRSEQPDAAFRLLVRDLTSSLPLRCAAYATAADRSMRDLWPADLELTPDLLDTALHVIRPEIFPLGSEFPFEASRFPQSEMLLLPLHRQAGPRAACILIADAGSFGESLEQWEELGRVIEELEQRCWRMDRAEGDCEELRRRVEESEALHTVGLAANRTLDIDEVLNLVARFTRALLGAHYVTVSTSTGPDVVTVASVGLRGPEDDSADDHLARSVLEAEQPLTIGGAESNLQIENFPIHAGEGMRTGLGIPLSLFGDTFGALIVGYRTETEVTARETRLALTLAGHAAVAISNARLHEQVEERSRQLKVAYDDLNQATAAKERFFASINHELRNPLGAVLGYQTLLLDMEADGLTEKGLGYLGKAQQAAETLHVLVNDLLDLSKIAAGKMEIDLQPCRVQAIVEQALNTIQPLAEQKGIALHAPPPDSLPTIVTDGKRVQQVLVNLLSNGVKFTERGEVRLEVRSGELPQEGAAADPPFIEFRVSDTGPGIPEGDLDRIFEEFEQVQGTSGGTGLGLPISRRLARLLGGDLWAESRAGGSTFIFRIGGVPEGFEQSEKDRQPSVQVA